MLIFVSWRSPVKHVHIEAPANEVLHQAVAGHQIQHVGAIDQRVDQQDGNRELVLGGRFIMVELRFILGPDDLFRRLTRLSLRTLQNNLHTRLVFLESAFKIGWCRTALAHVVLLCVLFLRSA